MNEDLLHACVDDALAPEARREVEDHLATHPEVAEKVRAYREQNAALRRLFDPVLDEPHGIALGVRRAQRSWPRSALALAASLILGVGIGVVGQRWLAPEREAMPIARQAALAHAAYVPEVRHPVEVAGEDEPHLVAWLSKRLAAPLKAPDLKRDGYHLLGGRLLPTTGQTGDAPVALLMYENAQGRRLSLMVRRAAVSTDTAFRFSSQGTTSVFYWIDGPFGYALVGDIGRDELGALAQRIYQQLNP